MHRQIFWIHAARKFIANFENLKENLQETHVWFAWQIKIENEIYRFRCDLGTNSYRMDAYAHGKKTSKILYYSSKYPTRFTTRMADLSVNKNRKITVDHGINFPLLK